MSDAEIRYVCNPTEPYSRFDLGDWLKAKRAAGKAPSGAVTVRVEHPDKEADGSCRWCGDTRSDFVELP